MIERLSRVLYVPRLDLQQQQKTSEGKSLLNFCLHFLRQVLGLQACSNMPAAADESSATTLGLEYPSSKAEEVAPLLQCLPRMQKIPGSIPSTPKDWALWYIPVNLLF